MALPECTAAVKVTRFPCAIDEPEPSALPPELMVRVVVVGAAAASKELDATRLVKVAIATHNKVLMFPVVKNLSKALFLMKALICS